jgi:hypothetical protein
VLDGLLLAGRTPPADRTAPDIAAGLASPPALELARMADHAAFAPAAGSRPNPAHGEAAWRLARQVRVGLRHGMPWYRKVFWTVDPRPLWRR